MSAGFSGEVVDFYAKHRRCYAPEVIAWLAETFRLDTHGTVLDLGCGTGQFTIPWPPMLTPSSAWTPSLTCWPGPTTLPTPKAARTSPGYSAQIATSPPS